MGNKNPFLPRSIKKEEGERNDDPMVEEALGFKRKRRPLQKNVPSSLMSEGGSLVAYREESLKKPNVKSSLGLVQDAEKTPKLSIQKKIAGSTTAKMRLHEICDAKDWGHPSYVLCKEEGPGHQKMFTFKVSVKIDDISSTNLECFGKPKQRKRAAQEDAADGALWYLKQLGCLPEA